MSTPRSNTTAVATNATSRTVTGTGASPGIAVGPIVRIDAQPYTVPDVEAPERAFAGAAADAHKWLMHRADLAMTQGHRAASEVLAAQALMAEDPLLAERVSEHLATGRSLGESMATAALDLADLLRSLSDPYLAARADDVGDVVAVIGRMLAGVEPAPTVFAEPSVLCARSLTAAETADLDPAQVLGFAVETGGATSHVSIIARSLGVPAVVGAVGLLDTAVAASRIAIDGTSGEVVLDPSAATDESFRSRARLLAERDRRVALFTGSSVRFDGHPVTVSANLGTVSDLDQAVEVGADGVGLFRTEFLFDERPTPPTEEEQLHAYGAVLESFESTVVVRTFDIGGDKPVGFVDAPSEENPFLGERGVRLYPRHEDLFTTQVRALLRASRLGKLEIMVPMVATLDEIAWVRAKIDRCAEDLRQSGHEVADPAVGIMVEVPSAALLASSFAAEVDFFSIGTNDLTQYTLAADRGNARLAHLGDALDPAVIALCRATIEGAETHDRPVSVCGLAASDPVAAVVLASLGVTKLSVDAGAVNLIKATLAGQSDACVRDVRSCVARARSAAELRAAVQELITPP